MGLIVADSLKAQETVGVLSLPKVTVFQAGALVIPREIDFLSTRASSSKSELVISPFDL